MGKKHKSTPSAQEMKEQAQICRNKEELHAHFEHLLKQLVDNPEKYKRGEFRYICKFVTFIEGHRDDFPHVMGDKLYEAKVSADNNWTNKTPSTGYIQALAQRREDTSDASPPQLSKSFIVKQNLDHWDLLTCRLKMGENPIYRFQCNSLMCLSVMATITRCLVKLHVILSMRQES